MCLATMTICVEVQSIMRSEGLFGKLLAELGEQVFVDLDDPVLFLDPHAFVLVVERPQRPEASLGLHCPLVVLLLFGQVVLLQDVDLLPHELQDLVLLLEVIEQLLDLGLLLVEAGPELLAHRVAGKSQFVDLPYNLLDPFLQSSLDCLTVPAGLLQQPSSLLLRPWGCLGLLLEPLQVVLKLYCVVLEFLDLGAQVLDLGLVLAAEVISVRAAADVGTLVVVDFLDDGEQLIIVVEEGLEVLLELLVLLGELLVAGADLFELHLACHVVLVHMCKFILLLGGGGRSQAAEPGFGA